MTEISKEIDDKVGPTTVDGLLSRNGADTSLLTGSFPVQGAYTRSGHDLMKKAISEARAKLTEDDWVMGEQGKNQLAQATDEAVLEETYYRDYSDQWRNFVKGVDVKRYSSAKEAENALQAFSLAKSPIEVLVIEIARNTNLSAPIDDGSWLEYFKSFIWRKDEQATGGSQPEKDFRPLFDFVGKKGDTENAPIARYRNELGLLARELSGKSEDEMKRIAAEMAGEEPRDRLKLGTREKNVNGMISSFNESPGSQELATLLMEPIDRLKANLGADVKSQLAKAWSEQILPAAKEIEKGYPFEEGQADSDLTKLTAFLNPADGKFSEFYDKRLSSYFEESNNELKLKGSADIQFSDEFVVYLNNAMKLRKVLFGTSPTPKFEYEFALRPSTGALIEVVIDGQKATSEGTGALKAAFPGSGSEIGVLMNLASTGTTSSTTEGSQPTVDGTQQLKFPGNWGLFRFVDAGRAQKQPGGEYLLTYSLGGKAVTATVRPSGGDLFDKTIFRQVRAPESFIK